MTIRGLILSFIAPFAVLLSPPCTASAPGQTIPTAPSALGVDVPGAQNWVRITQAVANPSPMLGEETELVVEVLVWRQQVSLAGKVFPHLPLSKVILNLPALERPDRVELVQPLKQLMAAHAPPMGHRGYRINSEAGETVFELEPPGQANGLDPKWYRRRFSIPVRFRQAGRVAIPAARIAGEVYLTAELLGSTPPARAGGRWEPFVAASAPLEIEVGDLAGAAIDPSILPAPVDQPPPAEGESAPQADPQYVLFLPLAVGILAAAGMAPLFVWGFRRLRARQAVSSTAPRPSVSTVRWQPEPSPTFSGSVRQRVHAFLQARFQVPGAALTPQETGEHLRQAGVSEELVRQWEELLAACDAAEFAPGLPAEPGGELAAAADRLMQAVRGTEATPQAAVPSR